ncbi:MAG: protein kinase [Verrucomicrobiales bacterium]|nr:protein kinase [Verrucomicrobiales bacterium]
MADRYKIYEQLGVGGTGSVFRAYDTQLKRWVAIKRLLTSKSGTKTSAEDRDELRQEADSLASLRHPNIVTIFDVGTDDEGVFMVMELLDGDDLADVTARGPLPYEDFKELAYQTLEGLLAAHQHHFLHRDIKPENIKAERLPGGRFQAKIIDFGLARAGLKARKQTEDVSGTVMGSVHYMAPEQLSREPVDERTDIYSLGCVFYEAVSGKKAFDGASMAEVVDRHLKHQVIPLNIVAPHVPSWLGRWIDRLISHNPSDRPASAQEAMEEFRKLERSVGYAPPPPAPSAEPVAVAVVVEDTPRVAPVPRPATTAKPAPAPATRRSPSPARSTPATPATPTRSAAASTRRPSSTSASSEKEGPNPALKIGLGAAAAVLLLLGIWWISSRKQPATTAGGGGGNMPSSFTPSEIRSVTEKLPAARVTPPLPDDRWLHVIASVGTFRPDTSSDGKPFPAYVDDRVAVWQDLAPRGKDNGFCLWQNRLDAAPRRVLWPTNSKLPSIAENRAALDFSVPDNLPKALEIPNVWRNPTAASLGQQTTRGPRGLTAVVVFQSPKAAGSARVLTLPVNQEVNLTLRIAPTGGLTVIALNSDAKSQISTSNIDASLPTIAAITWEKSKSELRLMAVNPAAQSGKDPIEFFETSPNVAMPDKTFAAVQLGRSAYQDKPMPNSGEWFTGLIAEVIVYASALPESDLRKLVSEQLAKYYFK